MDSSLPNTAKYCTRTLKLNSPTSRLPEIFEKGGIGSMDVDSGGRGGHGPIGFSNMVHI